MEGGRAKYWLKKFLLSALVAAEVMLLADAAVVFFGKVTPELLFLGVLGILTLVLFFWRGLSTRRLTVYAVALPLILLVTGAVGFGFWKNFSDNAVYRAPRSDKQEIFADRKVMLIVPHQDDDMNILGGVLEEYVRHGSEVYAVFVTNGDYVFPAETRYREAIAALGHVGIDEDHLIFLGYGDSWAQGGPHIYNAAPGSVMVSHAGKTRTYGVAGHGAWHEGQDYTVDNLMADLQEVILYYRPDVLFCTDYDHHIDHKSTTLLFDRVMGNVLKKMPAYDPVVYKAYAYSTAWEAEPDYFEENLASTKNVFGEGYGQQPAVYRWEDRVRLPVAGENLSRSLMSAPGYETLCLYKTQGTSVRAARMINGDKVFWQRHTGSVCYDAHIAVTSGNAAVLNDFMLTDNRDLLDESRQPFDGTWIPEDGRKMLTVTFPEAADVAVIRLYDHPSEANNVKNARILFDDGTQVLTGPLDPGGAATQIPVGKTGVSSFSVILEETEGPEPGLTEVEAFETVPAPEGGFLKLTDGEGNFAYDYRTGGDGIAFFRVYDHDGTPGTYTVTSDNAACTADRDDSGIWVECPAGESCVITVTERETGLTDRITVSNPGKAERFRDGFWQGVEKGLYLRYCEKYQENLFPARLVNKLLYELEH